MDYKFYLEVILKNLAEGIIVVDREANIVFFNEPVTDLAGIGFEEAAGKNILEVFPALTPQTSTFYQVLKSRKAIVDHVQTYTNNKGKVVTILTSTMPLIKNGELIGALEVFRDFTQVKELSEKVFDLQRSYSKRMAKEKPRTGNGTMYTFDDLIAASDQMKKLIARAKKVANSVSPVLIYGETGTGKEIMVQSIHNADPVRSKRVFIAQNCAALPKTLLESILFGTAAGSFTGAREKPGLFELADGGTLFLDEINSMDIELQGKLLRILEDGVVRRLGGTKTITVDVRTIASTNEDPYRAVEQGRLREDLFYRLNVVSLCIPPLRQRPEDIPPLVEHFIKMYNRILHRQVKGVSTEVMKYFLRYAWKGNVRELKYTIESIMNIIDIDDDIICMEHLPFTITNPPADRPIGTSEDSEPLPSLREAVRELERQLIKKAIRQANGNCAAAARLLRLPKQTLHNKIKMHKIRWSAHLEP